jgi:outer membrane protein assembly factor BamB
MASSPVVVGGTVVVQVENQGDSFVAGIDKRTGETRWRIERPRSANWSSPVVLGDRNGGDAVVVLQSRSGLLAVAPDTGRKLWRFEAGCSSMSSSVVDPDRQLILVPADGILALKFDAADQEPAEHWRANKLRLATVSPVACGGRVYTIKSPAILVCGDLETGEVLWQLRLKGQLWSTPVIAGDHLYAINRDGLAQVVKLGPERGEIAATYNFSEGIDATPAVSDGAYYVRCHKYLWKITAP